MRPSKYAALVSLLMLGLSACSTAAGPERELSGKQLYDRHCARCHGLDGKPTAAAPTARDLTNRRYIDSLGNRKIEMAIMAGRPAPAPGQPPAMPAFGGQFSDPELDLLVAYVRGLSNPELGPARMRPPAAAESAPVSAEPRE